MQYSHPIRLAAFDLDGTLLNSLGKVNPIDLTTLQTAARAGCEIVISSGRPYSFLPQDMMAQIGVRYAITTNGGAVYTVPDMQCISETPVPAHLVPSIIDQLMERPVYFHAFVDGKAIVDETKRHMITGLNLSEVSKQRMLKTARFTHNAPAFLKQNAHKVQKITINFTRLPDGSLVGREDLAQWLNALPDIDVVSGGNRDLEINAKGVSKGVALKALAAQLNIPLCQCMAVGDSGNDLDLLSTAGLGVAMANAEPDTLAAAQYVTTADNDHGGCAEAVTKFVLGQ